MADELGDFRAVMARLRAECPWKAAQTHASLTRYLLEEAHETVEAIETGSDDDLVEELGDLLLQVFFHAAIAEERGRFTVDDVAAGIAAKMRRRNPHVFGPHVSGPHAPGWPDPTPADPAAVNELWESVKATEKRRDSLLDGVPPTLPALLLADKVLDRRERAGAPPPPGPSYVLVPGRPGGPDPVVPLADALRRTGRPVVVAGDHRPLGGRVALVVDGDGEPGWPPLADDGEVVVTVHLDADPTRARPSGATPQVFLTSGDSPAATVAVVAAVVDGLAGRPPLADRLLALVGEARAQGVDAEQALRIHARALALEAQTDR